MVVVFDTIYCCGDGGHGGGGNRGRGGGGGGAALPGRDIARGFGVLVVSLGATPDYAIEPRIPQHHTSNNSGHSPRLPWFASFARPFYRCFFLCADVGGLPESQPGISSSGG